MNSQSTQKKDEEVTAPKAPFLDVLECRKITNFLSGHLAYLRYVRTFNESNPDSKKLPEVTLLGQISHGLKAQILDETLPSNLPCLREYYPASREFYTNSAAPLDELSQQAKARSLFLAKGLVDEVANFLKSELDNSMTISRDRDESESEHNDGAAISESSSTEHTNSFDSPSSSDHVTLQRHIHELHSTELRLLFQNTNSALYVYASHCLPDLFWDEEIIRIFFKHLLHEVLDNGQVNLYALIKDIKINWSNPEVDLRISNFMAKLRETFEKHSVKHNSPDVIEQLLAHVVSQWPDKLQDEWRDHRLGKGIPKTLDALTNAFKKFSKIAKNTQSKPFEPNQDKRKLPSNHTNPEPRGSAGGSGRRVFPGRGSSAKSDKEAPVPPNYPCLKCKKVAGHWPQDCPDLTQMERKLTIQQWKDMAKEHQQEKIQGRQNKKAKPSSYIDELKIFMARAQESDDHFQSTIVHANKECVLKTILDTGSDENVLTTSAFSLLNLPLPAAALDNPSVEMVDGRIEQSRGMVLIDCIRLANRLILRNINCVIIHNPEPFLLVGRPLMKNIGIDPQRDLNILLGNAPLDDDQLTVIHFSSIYSRLAMLHTCYVSSIFRSYSGLIQCNMIQ
jgi:hypothetical protein